MRRCFVPVLGALIALSACNQQSDGNNDIEIYLDGGFGSPQPPDNNDTDAGPPDTTYPAFMPDVPQVQNLGGGPVLTSPVIVPVFFSNDDSGSVSTLTDFDEGIGATTYWSAAMHDYSVGAATATSPYNSSESPTGTITDSQIQTWIVNKISTDPTFPAPTSNTVYVMHYPSVVTVAIPNGSGGSDHTCAQIGGYHSDIALSGVSGVAGADGGVPLPPFVAYAVVPRCSSFNGLDGIDSTTAAESHELAEAATDPYPNDEPAFSQVDTPHLAWELLIGGGEVGDMCVPDPQAYTQFDSFPHIVQRIWSNSSASAGHDPCVPNLPNEVYFNSVPTMTATTTLDFGENEDFTVESFNVPSGTGGTTSLKLFSDGPMTQPWSVDVVDISAAQGSSPSTTFGLDNFSGLNGNTLQLTATPIGRQPFGNADIFYVVSTAADETTHLWIGTVGVQ